jgi:hypothetical protein
MQRCENRNATAEQRASFGQIESVGQRADPGPLGADAIRETAVASHDRALPLGAKVMIARQTFMAVEATVRRPAETHALADFEPLRV